MPTNTLSAITSPTKKIDVMKAAIVAFLLGLGLIYAVGFAPVESLHDATHDSRHALSFPCH